VWGELIMGMGKEKKKRARLETEVIVEGKGMAQKTSHFSK